VLTALRQLPRNAELIFYLDPSSDGSEKYFLSIRDERFKLITSDRKSGFSQGLNIAIDESRGEFIARLDSDDLSLPWRWAYQQKKLKSVDVHFGSLLHQYQYGKMLILLPHYPVHLNSLEFSILATESNPGFHPAAMFRREVFESLGGYHDTLSEDYDFWLRALNLGYRFERGLVPVTLYRHHRNQATFQQDWELRVLSDPQIISQQEMLRNLLSEGDSNFLGYASKLANKQPLARLEFRKTYAKISGRQ
jgi:glycosyltransferase involved in cell wall biosynthesis